MERTIDELLMEKIHILTRRNRKHGRPPMMPHGPQMPDMMRGPVPEMPGMKHGPVEEIHKHRPHRFPRERILVHLLDNGDAGMHQKELAELMHVNPSSMSELIDKLEADRYIERTVDPEDKRATLITLTEKGKARAWEVRDERADAAAEVFKNLSEDEKKTLLVLLDKITAGKD